MLARTRAATTCGVIPELDMPGHLRAALARAPGAAGCRATRTCSTSPRRPPAVRARADPRVPRAVRRPLLARGRGRVRRPAATSAASSTGSTRLVRRHGRTLRVWHDGLTGVRLRRDVVVEWWADHAGPEPAHAARPGPSRAERRLVADLLRTSARSASCGRRCAPPTSRWQVNAFGGLAINVPAPPNPPQVVRRHRDRILGSELHVWNDDPTGETVAADRPRDRAAAARAGAEDLGHAAAGARRTRASDAVE